MELICLLLGLGLGLGVVGWAAQVREQNFCH